MVPDDRNFTLVYLCKRERVVLTGYYYSFVGSQPYGNTNDWQSETHNKG